VTELFYHFLTVHCELYSTVFTIILIKILWLCKFSFSDFTW